ncbi:serine hydrolase domain-containing protein [Sphingosinicella sp. LHD-64]|uniref:serine hydrolase domain-containing protein n=1 Tax=Sphingosinicella sp. LHD-64 TaxID=3072139 RepID=UPI00281098D2|nr:serine hydrolase domain-containing protein [Sphingosinicella sp. LHD-64]MDQ8756462.1 serine hydrolase domain-containing protein [Sphingosinicella sp. LHD-64]
MSAGRIAKLVVAAALLSGSATQAAAQDARAAPPDFANGLRRAIVTEGAAPERLPIAERMARWHVPGLSVALIEGCRVVDVRSFGVVRAGGPAVRPETLFQSASVSKPVAALAALRLVEQGVLDLDADVAARLRSWTLPASPLTEGHPVTLRGILSHSAGLVPGGYGGYARGTAIPTPIQTLNGTPPAQPKPVRVNYVPGSAWRYSGGGYQVAQLLMTEATGRPFPDIVGDLVLTRAGMTHSLFGEPPTGASVASGHNAGGQMIEGGWHIFPEYAAAGLWSTPSDLARFAIAVMTANRGEPSAILGRAMTAEMLETEIGPRSLGFVVGGEGQARQFGHEGANEGYNAMLIAFPETCQGAALMANSDNAKPLMYEVQRAIADAYGWPDAMASATQPATAFTPAILERFAGTYRFTEIDVPPFRIVRDEAGGLTFDRGDGHTEPLRASPDGLFAPDSGVLIRAVAPEAGPAGTITYGRIGGRGPAEARREPPQKAADAVTRR